MALKTITQKKASIKSSRGKNYRESLPLEGFSNPQVSHGKTKADVIAHYKKAAHK